MIGWGGYAQKSNREKERIWLISGRGSRDWAGWWEAREPGNQNERGGYSVTVSTNVKPKPP